MFGCGWLLTKRMAAAQLRLWHVLLRGATREELPLPARALQRRRRSIGPARALQRRRRGIGPARRPGRARRLADPRRDSWRARRLVLRVGVPFGPGLKPHALAAAWAARGRRHWAPRPF